MTAKQFSAFLAVVAALWVINTVVTGVLVPQAGDLTWMEGYR